MNHVHLSTPHLTRRGLGAMGLSGAAALAVSPIGSAHADPAPASDPRLVLPPKGGLRIDSPEFARLYGPGVFTMSALGNTVVGIRGQQDSFVSNRFRSTLSGHLASVRLFWPVGSGYSSNTGGRIKITLYPDDGSEKHLPNTSAAPLAQAQFSPNLTDSSKSKFDKINVTSSAPLAAGQLYHLVCENIDPEPSKNWISTDNTVVPTRVGRPGRWINNIDWATLMAYRTAGSGAPYSWINLTEIGSGGKLFSPIMQLTMADGSSQGVSDMESGSVECRRTIDVTATTPIRERFTPSSSKRVSGISVAGICLIAGELEWRLLDKDTELAKGSFVQEVHNYGVTRMKNNLIVDFAWYDAALPTHVVLAAKRDYDLELRAKANTDSTWRFACHRNGDNVGFTWPAAFTESRAQHLHDNEWLDTYPHDHSRSHSKPDANWPVVLHLAP